MQLDLFAEHDGCSGKTSPVRSPRTRDEILLAWLAQWLGPDTTYRPQDGQRPVLRSAITGWSNGLYWTRNFSEFRSGAVESSLSSILETGEIDPRYFLSPKAAAGILRRAEKRGKTLPAPLAAALAAVACVQTPTE